MQTPSFSIVISLLFFVPLSAHAQWRNANSTPQLPNNIRPQPVPVFQAPRYVQPAPAQRIVTAAPQYAQPLRAPMVVVPQGRFVDPQYRATENRQHLGTDYVAPANTPVYAAAAGKVQYNNTNLGNPFNSAVIVRQPEGAQVVYGHIYSTSTPGQVVQQGQYIGYVQPSNSMQPQYHPHVHIGVNTQGSAGQTGWGRAPATSTRQQIEQNGWRDFQSFAP